MRHISKVRKETINFSARQLQTEAGLTEASSLSTVYRVLNQAGFYFRHLKKKGILSPEDLKVRLRWAQANIHRPLSYWTNVSLYLDGVSFIYKRRPSDTGRLSRAKAWLRPQERLRITAKGRREHDGIAKTLHYLVGISVWS